MDRKQVHCAACDLKDFEIERLRALLWACWFEMNAINARDGAPSGVSQQYWDNLINLAGEASSTKPWPPNKEALSKALNQGKDNG